MILILLFASQAQAEGIAWQATPFDDALAEAAADGKMVLVDVYATWCGPCMRLDAETFPSEVVGRATSDLIALKIDAEAGEGPSVVERYHVVGYPTVLLLAPDGTEIDRIFGFMPADEFAQTVSSYREGRGTISELRAQVAASPDDLTLVLELGRRAAVRGENDEALQLLTRLIEEDADNALGLRVQAHHTLGKYMYLRGTSDYAAAIGQFEILLSTFPESDEARDANYQMSIALIRSGDEAGARARIAAAVEAAAGNPGKINSVCWLCFRESFDLQPAADLASATLEAHPQYSSLWDTYAEIQFALGDVAGAVASADRARTISPEEAYYQRQYERFSATP